LANVIATVFSFDFARKTLSLTPLLLKNVGSYGALYVKINAS
jgi:hypothetical protein